MSSTQQSDDIATGEDVTVALKGAMRRMPGAVAIITTRDPQSDAPAGLAASAVVPVSMEPPSMLISINRSASAHAAIERAGRYCVNLLGTEQTALVGLFSNSALRAERFTGEVWQARDGLPYLPAACAAIFCTVRATLLFGTHELFIGEVDAVHGSGSGDPLGWIDGGYARLGPL